MTNFGASFKKARESKGISLDRIAAETRISTRFLRAIENEEFHVLPGGIFNRGFVRTYAEKIGLDPEQAVNDYERLANVRAPGDTPLVSAARGEKKTDRRLYSAAIGGLVLLVIIFYLVTRESSNTAQTASAPPSPPAAVSAPAVVQPPLPTTPPETTSAAPEPEPASQSDNLRIDMEAKETTWVKVQVDGTTANPGEILEPGMTRHFTAHNSILLAIGNAAGLDLKINDMPSKNLGKSGQVRELNITPDNLKDFVK
jgi:cytoskeletal protein RodZ